MIDSEDEAEAEIATDVIGTDEEEVGAEALVVDLLEVEAVIVPLMTIALSLRNVLLVPACFFAFILSGQVKRLPRIRWASR